MLITLSYSKHIILIEGAFNERYHWSTVQAYRKCFAFCQSRMISFQKKKKKNEKRPLKRGFENSVSYRRNIETFPKLPYTTPFFS